MTVGFKPLFGLFSQFKCLLRVENHREDKHGPRARKDMHRYCRRLFLLREKCTRRVKFRVPLGFGVAVGITSSGVVDPPKGSCNQHC